MHERIVDLANWLGIVLPTGLDAPTATLRGAQLTATVALVAAAVAFITAIVAGGVALRNGYLTIRTTAQLKHADFRQTWINALRDEMTTFQSLAVEKEPWDDETDVALVKSSTKVLLLMNPDDQDYQALLNALHAVLSGRHVGRDRWLDAHADLIMLCQRILKREWNVTKREMHATAHIFFVRWAVWLCRALTWIADRIVYRPILRPFGRQLYRGDIKPFWDRRGERILSRARSHTPDWIKVRYEYWKGVWREKQEKEQSVRRPEPVTPDERLRRPPAQTEVAIVPVETIPSVPTRAADTKPIAAPSSTPSSDIVPTARSSSSKARFRRYGSRVWAAALHIYDGRDLR